MKEEERRKHEVVALYELGLRHAGAGGGTVRGILAAGLTQMVIQSTLFKHPNWRGSFPVPRDIRMMLLMREDDNWDLPSDS
jgi:hypothetical protein